MSNHIPQPLPQRWHFSEKHARLLLSYAVGIAVVVAFQARLPLRQVAAVFFIGILVTAMLVGAFYRPRRWFVSGAIGAAIGGVLGLLSRIILAALNP